MEDLPFIVWRFNFRSRQIKTAEQEYRFMSLCNDLKLLNIRTSALVGPCTPNAVWLFLPQVS